jgi:type I restriction enzyme M protein
LILDPKRWCQKYQAVVAGVSGAAHFRLGDALDFVASKFQKRLIDIYRYVEIAQIYENFGTYNWETHRGWNLPGRAKHVAQPHDFFVAHIWSSAGKWFIAGSDAAAGDLVVTSGCYHLRVRPSMEEYLPDLVFGFSTEAFRVQMRALATGSDGLSVVSETDFKAIILPRLTDQALRAELTKRISDWTTGGTSLVRLVQNHIRNLLPDLDVSIRPSHVAQV